MVKILRRQSDGFYFSGYDAGCPFWTPNEKDAKRVSPNADQLVMEVLGCSASYDVLDAPPVQGEET